MGNEEPDQKLQKVLATKGLGSRRKMEALIATGAVRVNGKTATLGQRVKVTDKIEVNKKTIAPAHQAHQYLIYHKSVGTIVENRAGINSVFTHLPPLQQGRWISVGRLDVATEGLLLFSTDGNWVNQMAHPSNGHKREYLVLTHRLLPQPAVEDINQNGIVLSGRDLIKPITISHLPNRRQGNWHRITVQEGRNRVIRRLFEHFDITIYRLIRTRFGHYQLPSNLPPNQSKPINRK